ncbi:MAG: PH domain-containing protein, partial [Acidobacteriota bacterium]|nr:PH domain-containing protein [Acidobacteriota bacterium]
MVNPLRDVVVRLFRIPPKPHPPSGSRASVKVFRASRRFYQYRLGMWGLKQIGAIAGIVAFIAFDPLSHMDRLPELLDRVAVQMKFLEFFVTGDGEGEASVGVRLLRVAELFGLTLFVLQMPFTYTMIRLDYELRWYIVTDRSLRIRYGVARIREMTMTFANIQNLSIEEGPLQRLLGIADLRVRSAGGGASEPGGESGE